MRFCHLEDGAGSQEGSRTGCMGSVVGKESIPARISSPSFACGSHLGRLGHVGHRAVRLGQRVLNPLKGAESVVWGRAAVPSVAVSLAPGLEEDRQRAGICLPHRLHESHDVGEDVAVDIRGAEAWPLTLILQHDCVPVPVLDQVQAVVRVPVQRLASRRVSLGRCRESGALGNPTNQTVNSVAARRVAVAEEEDVLVGAVASGLALLRESRILDMDMYTSVHYQDKYQFDSRSGGRQQWSQCLKGS